MPVIFSRTNNRSLGLSSLYPLLSFIDEELPSANSTLVNQHLVSHSLFSVAVLKYKLPLLKLKNTNIGFISRQQSTELYPIIEHLCGLNRPPLNRRVKIHAHDHELRHHGRQIKNAFTHVSRV